ncbi:MAG: DNA-directed RNA polymerase subunit L [Candidatus Bathyarchaeaceae archaeon]
MKVKVLEKTSNELKIQVEGEGHTFSNVLQKVLLEDDTVEMAGYHIQHPLIGNPMIYVRTKGKQKPEATLREATKKIRGQCKEFKRSFEKALKEWQEK